ncbi:MULTISPECIES: hypothetical protein [Helicobacter]|uniref:Cupin domain-containing protein n=2 Tax=Helicobacter bilis TaxID=37372 RepID=A0A6D2C652_9HELI|nr:MULTISPECIES: hypothetical protein [Helicobacter]EMZ40738.1 hypothetical protein C826_00572 [Helicobacter bilis WiWa]MDY5950143.1 hypothetical protein [Helicobacter sp.]TLE03610.1 hypothetical protein LS77_008560 [Helicobacter bilis]TLE04379.1 hypothetical protein LS76_008400 [Helicobacter bilis]
MQLYSLDSMIRGWFVGDFTPSVIQTKDFEVGIKYYKKGDYEECHTHKIATEITVIVTGSVRMKGKEYKQGDIIVIEPNESSDFLALSDCITAVVKTPSVTNDKYKV